MNFLRNCLKEHVIPKTFGCISDKPFSGEEFPEYQRKFLTDKIEKASWEVESAHLDLRKQMSNLQDVLQAEMVEGAKRKQLR